MKPPVLLCSSRRGQNIVSMVNKTESFFKPLNNPSLSSSLFLLLPPPLVTCCFLPATIVPLSVKWVTSPFPLVNRCDGLEKSPLCTSGLLSLFSVWVPFHLLSLDVAASGAHPHDDQLPAPPLL